MRCAGAPERLGEFAGHAASQPQQRRLRERGLRLRHDDGDGCRELLSQAVQPTVEGAAFVFAYERRTLRVHHFRYALPRQIRRIVEAFQRGRFADAPAQLQAVAVAEVGRLSALRHLCGGARRNQQLRARGRPIAVVGLDALGAQAKARETAQCLDIAQYHALNLPRIRTSVQSWRLIANHHYARDAEYCRKRNQRGPWRAAEACEKQGGEERGEREQDERDEGSDATDAECEERSGNECGGECEEFHRGLTWTYRIRYILPVPYINVRRQSDWRRRSSALTSRVLACVSASSALTSRVLACVSASSALASRVLACNSASSDCISSRF